MDGTQQIPRPIDLQQKIQLYINPVHDIFIYPTPKRTVDARVQIHPHSRAHHSKIKTFCTSIPLSWWEKLLTEASRFSHLVGGGIQRQGMHTLIWRNNPFKTLVERGVTLNRGKLDSHQNRRSKSALSKRMTRLDYRCQSGKIKGNWDILLRLRTCFGGFSLCLFCYFFILFHFVFLFEDAL